MPILDRCQESAYQIVIKAVAYGCYQWEEEEILGQNPKEHQTKRASK